MRDWLRWIATELSRHELAYGHGTEDPWDEAAALVTGALHIPPPKLQFVLDAALTRTERTALLALVRRRIVFRVPVPYLVGEAWFAGHGYFVDERVLIPRSPIAELIERRFAPWLADAPGWILDLCTGSGCIGIACALEFPEAEVIVSDIDPGALAVARANVARHGVDDRVTVTQSDLFASLPPARFDVIVSNPPYVDDRDFASLPREYLHEPRAALRGGADGLALVRRILAEARPRLAEHGWLVVEVGNSMSALIDAFPEMPFVWPDFERGAGGVFLLEAASLS